MVCREPGSDSRARIERELQRIDVSPGQVSELGSTEAVKQALREGLGIGFLSRFAVADEVARGELDVFRLRGRPPLERELSVTRLASRALAPAEMAFVATLTHCCARQVAYAKPA